MISLPATVAFTGARRALSIQLWSIYYEPVPTGIGPISTSWAKAMQDRGHEVTVVTSHPHYPVAAWGRRLRPYREVRDGIPVLRLPLLIGRETSAQRLRQELSFAVAQSLALGALEKADVVVAVSPSFPALVPTLLNARLRRQPWVLWLQDILPEGASSTGLMESQTLLSAARRLELAAYRSAGRVVVISEAFKRNLRDKGVPPGKLEQIYNPATRTGGPRQGHPDAAQPRRVLSMGNIGLSQGLARVVRTLQSCAELTEDEARLVVVGHGVAAKEVEAEVRTQQVEMLGLVSDERLEQELQHASLGLVTQRPGVSEFNLPSKLMNFMAYGIPVVAFVDPGSETARIVERAGAGWVADSRHPRALCTTLAVALADRGELQRRGAAARLLAQSNFTPSAVAEQFERVLLDALAETDRRRRA